MKHIKYILFAFTILLLNCTEKKIDNENINKFINKYEMTDFSEFRNYTIAIRQKTLTETIYLITNSQSNIDNIICFVYVNRFNDEIEEFKKVDPKLCIKKEKEIRNIIINYKKFNFPYLSVDRDGTFCVNPFYADMKPYLLKLKTKSDEKTIRKNLTIFKHLKDNWYIRE